MFEKQVKGLTNICCVVTGYKAEMTFSSDLLGGLRQQVISFSTLEAKEMGPVNGMPAAT